MTVTITGIIPVAASMPPERAIANPQPITTMGENVLIIPRNQLTEDQVKEKYPEYHLAVIAKAPPGAPIYWYEANVCLLENVQLPTIENPAIN